MQSELRNVAQEIINIALKEIGLEKCQIMVEHGQITEIIGNIQPVEVIDTDVQEEAKYVVEDVHTTRDAEVSIWEPLEDTAYLTVKEKVGKGRERHGDLYKITDPEQYRKNGTHCMHEIKAPFDVMVKALGMPFVNIDDGREEYPDDPNKTDVCWALEDDEGGEARIWNYKTGRAYQGEGAPAISQLDRFSLWVSSQKIKEKIDEALHGEISIMP